MQSNVHIFQGMRRDSHPIKQDSKFLWDAHNIRITTRDDNTMLSITNEKSTKSLHKFESNENYVGHVVIGDYLILFIDSGLTDRIYRINLKEVKVEILYEGKNLLLRKENPIQTVVDYESELVQKVYWTDNNNPPRLINVAKPELVNATYSTDNGYSDIYTDAPFNFVQFLSLKEEVSLYRKSSNLGTFPSGTIQYALTYIHKYGQESNIFHTTELQYISYEDRGASPEDRVNTSFVLKVVNPDVKFNFIRVYSIIRTSIDATPTVKRVLDYPIGKSNKPLFITDTGTQGDIIDPYYLLYVGGKDILAGCIYSKDNTLFLGNITYKRKSIYDLNLIENNKLKYDLKLKSDKADTMSNFNGNLKYLYFNQLRRNTSTFKNGETYRLGCRFQYVTGEWSEPVWIDDFKHEFRPNIASNRMVLGGIYGTIPEELNRNLALNNYIRVQPLIVYPTNKDRTILAQGFLCPTVGNVGNRVNKNGAYAQSSWILRPFNNKLSDEGYKGSTPACQHDYSLPIGCGRSVELQTMVIDPQFKDVLTENVTLSYDTMTAGGIEDFHSAFVVDQSIVTFHSPDVEFGDLAGIINSGAPVQLNSIGSLTLDYNKGEIDIQTKTPTISPESSGFFKRSIEGDGGKALISGLFYEDEVVDDVDEGKKFKPTGDNKLWMTYMWHRNGSLNNDCSRPEGSTRSGLLDKKKIVNMHVVNDDTLQFALPFKMVDIKYFNSNEVSLVKLNRRGKSLSYYGNIDTLIPAYSKYFYVYSFSKTYTLVNKSFTLNGKINPGNIDFTNIKVTGATGTNNYVKAGGSNSNITGVLPYEDSTVRIDNNSIMNLVIKDGKFSGSIFTTKELKTANNKKVPKGYYWRISGDTTFVPIVNLIQYTVDGVGNNTIEFTEEILPLGSDIDYSDNIKNVGDFYSGLKYSKEGVRLKYKSTPHLVAALEFPLNPINMVYPAIQIAELIQDPGESRYGGTSEEAIKNNLWIPAGKSRLITDGKIIWDRGDTWYQRYDCLKTYPFTNEDPNQVTEIVSMYLETRINLDGRYDKNRNNMSFYLSPNNFNKINPAYSQLDSYFTSRVLDKDFYKVKNYPSQFIWTNSKSPASVVDPWTNLHLANTYDLDGSNGRLVAIKSFNELLVGFQENAMSQLLFNSRVQLQASDGVPIEIANSQKLEGSRAISANIGCQDYFSIVTTPLGIYFVDNYNATLWKYDGQLSNLGLQLGSLYWARENKADNNWMFKTISEGSPGIRLDYDAKYQDIYFTPSIPENGNIRESLCYSEQLGQFTSNMSYGGSVMFSWQSKFYSLALDKADSNLTLWENFAGDGHNNIFNGIVPYGISFISNEHPNLTKIFDTLEMRADLYSMGSNTPEYNGFSHTNQVGNPFTHISVENEYQNTGTHELDDKSFRKKFRIWRATLPRSGRRDRIVNPWCKITLENKSPGNKSMILHDLSVGYTI